MNSEIVRQVLSEGHKLRENRRSFLTMAGATGAAIAGGAMLASCGDDDNNTPTAATPTPAPTTATFNDVDILNFALNLEYLEAEFYLYATTGSGLPAAMRTGTVGTQGTVTPGRAVTFTDPLVRQYAREIAADEMAHVAFLRSALGPAAVAEPTIDVGFSATSAFSNAARAAKIITGATAAFDPYASDEAFLLGAFIFEDVGVTAYKGAAPLLTKTYLEAAAGILAAEAYHAGLVRTVLYRKGMATPAPTIGNATPPADLITATELISDLRDGADNSGDDDQGIRGTTGANAMSNLVPTGPDGIVYSRSPGDVLNIAYLTGAAVRTSPGSFFPNGVNGTNALFTTSTS